jgi:two-component system, NarL family, sensor kinase
LRECLEGNLKSMYFTLQNEQAMNRMLLILLLSLYNSISFAQVPDSLYTKLSVAKEDTNKSKILSKISRYYSFTNHDSALYYINKSKTLAEKLDFKKSIILNTYNACEIYDQQGKFDTSFQLTKKNITTALSLGNDQLIAICYGNLALAYSRINYKDSCVYYNLKSLSTFEKMKDSLDMLFVYGNLSALYTDMKQFEKGKIYASKAVLFSKNGIGNREVYVFTLTNLASAYFGLKEYDSVLVYANEAIKICKQDSSYIPNYIINIQNSFHTKIIQKKYDELQYYIVSMKAIKSIPDSGLYQSTLFLNEGYNDYYHNNLALSKVKTLESLRFSISNNVIENERRCYQLLQKIEVASGNFAMGDFYVAKEDSINQVQLNEEIIKNVTVYEKKYETEKKDNEILKLNSINQQKSTLNKFLIGSAIGLVLFSLLGYRNFKNKQKVSSQQQEIQQQKITELEKDKQLSAIDAMLQGQEEERSRIAKDLHDGLGGMLSGTKLSFINMKENLVLTPENATQFDKSLSMLDNTIADLRKVAHNLMPEALVKFGLQEAVRDFCNSIQSSTNLKIVYQPLGDNRKLSNTAEVFTYRIIQELVNNAVKHANASQIIVQLTTNNNKIGIAVEDDGKGFDTNALANSKGAGLDNIKYRVQYFNGTIDTVTSAGNGTSVNIELVV